MNSFVAYTNKPCPFNWGKSFSLALKQMVVSLIVSLRFCIGPTTVFRAVRAIYLYSVKRVFFRWCLPHVDKEVLKRLPPVADKNTPSPIIWEVKAFRIFTPAAQHAPSVVFFCRSPTIGVSALTVLNVCLGGTDFLKAAARLCMFASQLFRLDGGRISTRTFANPVSFFALALCTMEYSKLTMDLILHVNNFGHLEHLYG